MTTAMAGASGRDENLRRNRRKARQPAMRLRSCTSRRGGIIRRARTHETTVTKSSPNARPPGRSLATLRAYQIVAIAAPPAINDSALVLPNRIRPSDDFVLRVASLHHRVNRLLRTPLSWIDRSDNARS